MRSPQRHQGWKNNHAVFPRRITKEITREMIREAMHEFFARGGRITRIDEIGYSFSKYEYELDGFNVLFEE